MKYKKNNNNKQIYYKYKKINNKYCFSNYITFKIFIKKNENHTLIPHKNLVVNKIEFIFSISVGQGAECEL